MTSALREATDRLSEILSEPLILIQGEGLARYRHAMFVAMISNPFKIKAALVLGQCWEHFEEDLDALDQRAFELLDAGGLSPTRRAEIEAAQTAIDDIRQQRMGRDD